jgi:hypothetical protein
MPLSLMINETWYKQFAKLLHCRAIDQSDSAFVVRRNEPINSVHLQLVNGTFCLRDNGFPVRR